MNIPAPVIQFANKTGRWLVKHGPKLMSVGGGVMAVGGAVMACKATLHADEVLDRHKQKMAKIEAAKALSDDGFGEGEYTDAQMKKDKAIVYAETTVEFVKLYAPSVSVGLAGVGLMQGAFYISERRGAQTLAALTAMNEMYNDLLAKNPELVEEVKALPVEKKEVRIKKLPEVSGDSESDDAAELVLEDYIPVEMFDVLENDPFIIKFDATSEGWHKGRCFVLNSNEVEHVFRTFSLRRETGHDIWVNDIRRAFDAEEKSLGWSHGYTSAPGDAIGYEIYPFVYKMVDDMVVGMSGVPGKTNEERLEQVKNLELSDGPDRYCYVIALRNADCTGAPRFIRNEVYGK